MPELTIVLSGPRSSESQARTALASEGFNVLPDVHDHGLPAERIDPEHRPKGHRVSKQAISFLTITAPEERLNDTDCMASLHYERRMHYEPSPPAPPSAEELLRAEIASLRADVDALKGGGS